MITVTLKLFGFIPIGTFHIPLPIDLPVEHYNVHVWQLSIDITTGPRSTPAPAHSVEAVKVIGGPADPHDAPPPEVDLWS